MIAEFFKDVTEISGVDAIVLFNNQNGVIESWSGSKYNPGVFTEMGESLLHIFGLLEYLKYDMNELVVPFDKGLLYARTHPKFYMVVLAKLSVEVPLVRLAMNVCLKEFEEDRKVKKLLKKLSDNKFFQIKSITLDDTEKIMLENILEESNGAK
ncbi:MAG: hypothetical protein HUU32_07310 [Calditrichaceae bacterium]|nr:hypothetical protein [Calditrichia bacterium]NUQ41188.1 hypothetical protein [Calditrichaceae bacterium]